MFPRNARTAEVTYAVLKSVPGGLARVMVNSRSTLLDYTGVSGFARRC